MPADLWDWMIADAPLAYVRAGGLIYAPGDLPPVIALLSGTARVFLSSRGTRQFTLRYGRAGDLLGLGAVLSGSRATGAEAVTDATAAIVSMERLRQGAGEHHELCWQIGTQLAASALTIAEAAAEEEHQPMAARVARHLLELAFADGEGRLVAAITHQRLADAVGTAREVITRTLAALRAAGVIHTASGRVILREPRRLALIATGVETCQ